jgi:hypothetical protein
VVSKLAEGGPEEAADCDLESCGFSNATGKGLKTRPLLSFIVSSFRRFAQQRILGFRRFT